MSFLKTAWPRVREQVQPAKDWLNHNATNVIYALFFLTLAYMTSTGMWGAMTRTYSYMTSDWGVNYAGGFVRRGLLGDIVLRLCAVTGLTFDKVAGFIAVIANLAYVGGAALLCAPLRRNVWGWCLIYAPASIAFMAVNPHFLGHKDIVLLAVGAMLFAGAAGLPQGRGRTLWVLGWLSLSIPLVLIHEGFAIYLPILFVALSTLRLTPKVIASTALICIGIIAAALVSVKFNGTIDQRDQMLNAFLNALPVDWSIYTLDEFVGIWFVGQNLSETFNFAAQRNFDALPELPRALFLVFIPLGVAVWKLRTSLAFQDIKGKISAALIVLSAVCTIVLMPLIIDWMRFIIMFSVLATFAIIMRMRLFWPTDQEPLPGEDEQTTSPRLRWMMAWGLVAAIVILKPGKVSPNIALFDWKDVFIVLLIAFIAGYGPNLRPSVRHQTDDNASDPRS